MFHYPVTIFTWIYHHPQLQLYRFVLSNVPQCAVQAAALKCPAVRPAGCSGRCDGCDSTESVVQRQMAGRSGFTGWRHRRDSATSLILREGCLSGGTKCSPPTNELQGVQVDITSRCPSMAFHVRDCLSRAFPTHFFFWLACTPLEYSAERVPQWRSRICPPTANGSPVANLWP